MGIVIFDVGSHDGTEFLSIVARNPDVHVYAFEPTPWAAEAIRNRTQSFSNFTVIEKAVSLEDSTAELTIAKGDTYHQDSGCNSIHKWIPDIASQFPESTRWYGEVDRVTVQTTRLDTFIEETGITHIDFIHIDAQGEDLNVLKSLGKYKSIVTEGVFELATNSHKSLYTDNPDILEGLLWLKDNGFKPISITPNDPQGVTDTVEHNVRFMTSEGSRGPVFFKIDYMDKYSMKR